MKSFIAALAVVVICSVANAAIISDTGTASFFSSGQPAFTVNVDSFDTSLGILTGVKVEFTHSGSVNALADNDDAFNPGVVSAQMIRSWSATGPGVVTAASKVLTAAPVVLLQDDGDGGDTWSFDPTTPDGFDFSPQLAYLAEADAGSPFAPALGLYQTAGPGTVSFVVKPLQMVNKLQWIGEAPDVWQQKVEKPKLDVNVTVTYEYIPEPASLAFLALGLIPVLRRRTAA